MTFRENWIAPWPGRNGCLTSISLMLVACFIAPRIGASEDVVVVSRSEPSGESRRRGTIIDYTGEALTLELSSGRKTRIEPSRVRGYETKREPAHKRGDELFEEKRYADAVVSYRNAMEPEQRRWMRRVILAQMVRCYHNMRQIVQAGETFRLILQSDPSTQLLDAMPLPWTSAAVPSSVAERAGRWIKDDDIPGMRLIGASWLLGASSRQEAIQVLNELSTARDPRIAKLSEAQLWRTRLVTAPPEALEPWEKELLTLPASLRAGPYFLLGKLRARHKRHQAAVLAFMRVPILYSSQHDLVAEALFAAGEQLEKTGEQEGAHTVYRELVNTHQDHRLAPLAQQRLP
ncbi:MAG: tetratricopeptide repeat protein [Planctomycetota bacterium]